MNRILAAMAILVSVIGCSQAPISESQTEKHLTPVVFNTAGAPTIEFSAPDMMCPDGCGEKVKEILSGQPGAKEVMIDFDNKKAIVAVEAADKFDANVALAALVDHGFKNSSLKAEASPAAASSGEEKSTPEATSGQ
jgi:copper chaperone CopZ